MPNSSVIVVKFCSPLRLSSASLLSIYKFTVSVKLLKAVISVNNGLFPIPTPVGKIVGVCKLLKLVNTGLLSTNNPL